MFYDNFIRLCAKENISPSAAAEEMGFYRSVVTRWGKGGNVRKATLERVANYFGVTVDDLIGDDSAQKEKPTAQGDGLISDLPQDVQKLIFLCQESPQLASALLNLAQQLQNRSSGQA
jgi:transcriptional regulator with XRE-family HTH domain|nr:MAG TPA: Cro/C1-type HTH DNA-binding domain protein [Caudoviricetes sp.]